MKKIMLGAVAVAALSVGIGGTAEAGWLTPTNGTSFTNVNGQNFNVIKVPPKATPTATVPAP